jgi:membrane protein YdbS with pleckstrin-like domain
VPTRYHIRGTDASGRPARREVLAESLAEAEQAALDAGLSVKSITVADDAEPSPTPPTAPSSTPPPGPNAADSAAPGSEQIVWTGTPSHWSNFWIYLACIVLIPIPWAFWQWLSVRASRIVITSQRLRLESGVLAKRFEEIELYRVKDSSLAQSFGQRLVGIGDVVLETNDATTPHVRLANLRNAFQVRELLRAQVERVRRVQRVREIEMS